MRSGFELTRSDYVFFAQYATEFKRIRKRFSRYRFQFIGYKHVLNLFCFTFRVATWEGILEGIILLRELEDELTEYHTVLQKTHLIFYFFTEIPFQHHGKAKVHSHKQTSCRSIYLHLTKRTKNYFTPTLSLLIVNRLCVIFTAELETGSQVQSSLIAAGQSLQHFPFLAAHNLQRTTCMYMSS
ncbi:hypothetical protein ACJX0J_036957, partial [Zea mays]